MSKDDKVKKLLEDAHVKGALSAKSLTALDVVDVGAQIQAGLGVTIDDVTASEVVLLTMMPDDSASIAHAGNTDAVRDGHNFVIDALKASKQSGEVLAHTRYLNGHVLCAYTALEHAVAMSAANYDPRLGTPLFDQACVVLGTVIAKAHELAPGLRIATYSLAELPPGVKGPAQAWFVLEAHARAELWLTPQISLAGEAGVDVLRAHDVTASLAIGFHLLPYDRAR